MARNCFPFQTVQNTLCTQINKINIERASSSKIIKLIDNNHTYTADAQKVLSSNIPITGKIYVINWLSHIYHTAIQQH